MSPAAPQSHYLRLLPVNPEHVYAYWALPRSEQEGATRYLRIHGAGEQVLVEAPVHGAQGEQFLRLPATPGAVTADLGDYDGGTFRPLIHSSRLNIPARSAGGAPVRWRKLDLNAGDGTPVEAPAHGAAPVPRPWSQQALAPSSPAQWGRA